MGNKMSNDYKNRPLGAPFRLLPAHSGLFAATRPKLAYFHVAVFQGRERSEMVAAAYCGVKGLGQAHSPRGVPIFGDFPKRGEAPGFSSNREVGQFAPGRDRFDVQTVGDVQGSDNAGRITPIGYASDDSNSPLAGWYGLCLGKGQASGSHSGSGSPGGPPCSSRPVAFILALPFPP
jgi:hypothetical protein